MRSASYNNFYKFYDENKSKLRMPKKSNYPINYNKAKHWSNSQCDIDSRDFADTIIEHTKYVSFCDFEIVMKKICESYLNTYSAENDGGTYYVLILPWNIHKSNMWASLLAFKYLKHIINDICYDITDVYNNTKNHRSHLFKKKVRCIICDDCAYTGHQISIISTIDSSRVNFPGKHPPPPETDRKWRDWYSDINILADKVIRDISVENFSVDLILPYMSTLAQSRIRSIHYIKIPKDCVVFPIFNQQVDIDRIPNNILNVFKGTFQYHKDISAIYFDHKIADAVSTFHKIYLLAPLFNCAMENMSIGFIENCKSINIPKNISIYEFHMDLEKSMKKICPSAFYKSIKYTLNGKIVERNCRISDIIENKH